MLSGRTYLNSNREMPLLGLGVYKALENGEVENAIRTAVQCGYRLIDTASVYKNEEGVRRGIAGCGVSRDKLFITSKVWNNAQRLDDVEGAFERSLDRLGLDYVDLYLIHWPVPGCILNTWKVLEKFYRSGRALSIGVSNFDIRHLEELAKYSDIVPAVNQIEFHPLCYPKELLEYCQDRGIQVQAYAPLARGAYLDDDLMCILATKYAKTPAQIGLRWALQKGVAVIPKSTNPDHIRINGDLYSFEILDEDMKILDSMNRNYHSSGVPEDLKDLAF
mgnify:FL=1